MTKIVAKIKGINPTKSQRDLINAIKSNKYKYICAAFSRQCGKSTALLLMCVEWLLSQNEEIIYFTPKYKLGREFYSKLIKILPKELITKSNSTELIVETITNSKLRFFSGESPQSARGNNCTRLIIDEAAYIKDEVDGQSFWYNIVVPLLKAKGKTAILISTPFGKQGFFYDLCMKGYRGEEDYCYINKTIYDDELSTSEQKEKWKKEYPKMAWECEFECKFISNALSVFPDYEELFVEGFRFNKSNICCGIDLSSVGEDNTVVTFINDKKQVEQHIINGELDYKYRQIANLINSYNPKLTYIESNSIGEVMINEIKKYVKNKQKVQAFTTTNETKKIQVGLVSVAITNKEITFDKNNKILYSELGTFSYKLSKNNNITYAATPGNHDDTVMSLCLAMQAKDDSKCNITKDDFTFITNSLSKYDLR